VGDAAHLDHGLDEGPFKFLLRISKLGNQSLSGGMS